MHQRLKNAIKYILSGALMVILLYFSFRGVKWADFWAGIKSCAWEYVLVSMSMGAFVCFLRGWRWRMLLDPIDPATKTRTCFNAVNISYVANMVVPRIGEFVRCGYITNRSSSEPGGKKRASYDKVFGTVLVERGLDLLTMFLFLFIMLACMWNRFGSFFSEKMLQPVSEKLSFNALWLVVMIVVLIVAFFVLVYIFRDRSRFCGKIWGVLSGVWRGMTASFHMKSWWRFLALTILIWVCYWFESAAILWAVRGMDTATLSLSSVAAADISARIAGMDMMDAMFLMFVGGLSSIVPVPGGFGAFHYLVSLALFTIYGIPMEIGVIFATLSHESQAVTQIFLGLCSYVYETLKK